jgi:hypothetical protein
MADRNQPTVFEYLRCIGESLENLQKDPTSRQSLNSAIECWTSLVNMLGAPGPGICKFGIPQYSGEVK